MLLIALPFQFYGRFIKPLRVDPLKIDIKPSAESERRIRKKSAYPLIKARPECRGAQIRSIGARKFSDIVKVRQFGSEVNQEHFFGHFGAADIHILDFLSLRNIFINRVQDRLGLILEIPAFVGHEAEDDDRFDRFSGLCFLIAEVRLEDNIKIEIVVRRRFSIPFDRVID